MSKHLNYPSIILLFLVLTGCNSKSNLNYRESASSAALLHACTDQLTDIIIFDGFKPSVASRIYGYSFLAAYEVLIQGDSSYKSYVSGINELEPVPSPLEGEDYCFPLAGLHAFATVARTYTFSQDKWDKFDLDFFKKFKEMGIPEDVYKRSIEYGGTVASHIIEYSNKDGYKTTRGLRHTLSDLPGGWSPTPPTYAEACEPSWNKVRTFVLDSCSQFAPPPPAPFDLNKESEFYKMVREVYDLSNNLTDEQKAIAYFWDDNAMVTNIVGHTAFAEKKMGPSSHWVQLTNSILRNEKLDFRKSVEIYSLVSFAVNDAFTASWDVKYKTDRIRPVTVINNTIDNKWLPFLETPPFPEYTSAHSTISAAAGTVLTHFFGENYAFTDSTEYKYGHGVRSFKSFEETYWETSLSRIYGGIHFRDGIEQGTIQGEKIGGRVLEKLKGKTQSTLEVVAGSSFE